MEDREYAARILAYRNAGETIPKRHLTEQEQRLLFRAFRKKPAPPSGTDAPTSDDKLPAVAPGSSYL